MGRLGNAHISRDTRRVQCTPVGFARDARESTGRGGIQAHKKAFANGIDTATHWHHFKQAIRQNDREAGTYGGMSGLKDTIKIGRTPVDNPGAAASRTPRRLRIVTRQYNGVPGYAETGSVRLYT